MGEHDNPPLLLPGRHSALAAVNAAIRLRGEAEQAVTTSRLPPTEVPASAHADRFPTAQDVGTTGPTPSPFPAAAAAPRRLTIAGAQTGGHRVKQRGAFAVGVRDSPTLTRGLADAVGVEWLQDGHGAAVGRLDWPTAADVDALHASTTTEVKPSVSSTAGTAELMPVLRAGRPDAHARPPTHVSSSTHPTPPLSSTARLSSTRPAQPPPAPALPSQRSHTFVAPRPAPAPPPGYAWRQATQEGTMPPPQGVAPSPAPPSIITVAATRRDDAAALRALGDDALRSCSSGVAADGFADGSVAAARRRRKERQEAQAVNEAAVASLRNIMFGPPPPPSSVEAAELREIAASMAATARHPQAYTPARSTSPALPSSLLPRQPPPPKPLASTLPPHPALANASMPPPPLASLPRPRPRSTHALLTDAAAPADFATLAVEASARRPTPAPPPAPSGAIDAASARAQHLRERIAALPLALAQDEMRELAGLQAAAAEAGAPLNLVPRAKRARAKRKRLHKGGGDGAALGAAPAAPRLQLRLTSADSEGLLRSLIEEDIERLPEGARGDKRASYNAAARMLQFIDLEKAAAILGDTVEAVAALPSHSLDFRVMKYFASFSAGYVNGGVTTMRRLQLWAHEQRKPPLPADSMSFGGIVCEEFRDHVDRKARADSARRNPAASQQQNTAEGSRAAEAAMASLRFMQLRAKQDVACNAEPIKKAVKNKRVTKKAKSISLRALSVFERGSEHDNKFIAASCGGYSLGVRLALRYANSRRTRLHGINPPLMPGVITAVCGLDAKIKYSENNARPCWTSSRGVRGTSADYDAVVKYAYEGLVSPAGRRPSFLVRKTNAPLETVHLPTGQSVKLLRLDRATAFLDEHESGARAVAGMCFVLRSIGGFPLEELTDIGEHSARHFLPNVARARSESKPARNEIGKWAGSQAQAATEADLEVAAPASDGGAFLGDDYATEAAAAVVPKIMERQHAACRALLADVGESGLPYFGGWELLAPYREMGAPSAAQLLAQLIAANPAIATATAPSLAAGTRSLVARGAAAPRGSRIA